jgi:hypothetical protein
MFGNRMAIERDYEAVISAFLRKIRLRALHQVCRPFSTHTQKSLVL